MTRTTVRDVSSRAGGSPETFADRLAHAIGDLLVKEPPQPLHVEPHLETLEQLIARAIYKELPR